jgi:hypothetical protein
MAVIHRTTLAPSKLALLTPWLPAQPWYRGRGGMPELSRAGGFRLDDPDGAVGIEFFIAADGSGDGAQVYLLPLTYRSAPGPQAADGLLGTAEHGVLGQRWMYDGTRDPVLVAALVAFFQGDVQAQAQSESDTPDLTVTSHPVTAGRLDVLASAVAADGPDGTDVRVTTAGGGDLIVRMHRLLQPGDGAAAAGAPRVAASWQLPSGGEARGVVASVR